MGFELVLVYFVMTVGGGFIPPQYVYPADMACGLPGAVVGVQVDRLVNPLTIEWPDPFFAGVHCRVDVSASVAALPPGEYHIATTIVGDGTAVPYTGHDPHTTELWRRDTGTGPPPVPRSTGSLRIRPQP